ncbi:BamA/TamA family outer membrane protein [Algibacter aquimarinus]|uniref:BamA/TamA family outer membrane protein n=1 Tax=Algibacter aquimarinus TaxID=1136748 RepID=A0ABP9H873_9FLAO
MQQTLSKILIFIIFTRCFTSCDAVKRVAEDKNLLTKNTVLINEKKDNTETINSLLYQEPNRKILGVPLRLHIYNMARPNRDSLFENWLNKKPERKERLKNIYSQKQVDKFQQSVLGFNNWLKTTGEAPVIVSEEKTKKTVKRLQDYHINNGWFNVKTTYNINKKENQRAEVEYKVETGKGFILDSISSKVASPTIDTLYKNIKENSLIVSGEQYETANFENERDRISSELRNSGIYHFNQDYVSFEIDTIGTDKKVNVGIQIQDRAIRTPDSIRREPFKVYHIDEVNIITDYTFENRGKPFQDSIRYNGYNLYAYDKIRYRPKAITDAMFINPGTIFKDIDRTRTYRYINELRTFKYPNIEYVENPDYTLTDTIRLTPLKKFSLGLSADVSQSNIQTVGLSVNPSLLIRNIFKGAETFQISGIAAIGSSDERNDGDPFFDINEIGIDLKLTIPRLFSPFYTENIIPKYMSPSTRISLSTTSQTNIGLDKQTLVGTFNYNWYPNTKTTNKLDLFNIQYVRNLNVDNYFGVYQNSFDLLNQTAKDVNFTVDDLNLPNPDNPVNEADEFIDYALAENTPPEISTEQRQTINGINERKNRLTENNLILSSSFSFVKDQRTNIFDNNFSIFRFKLELAGNLLATASNLIGLEKDEDGRYELLNVAFSQYVKTEFDYVKHWDLGRKNVFAMRSFLGIAIPYGNSTNIPFAKSFFAGGPNDNRAWTAYSLGPGSSETTNEFNEANLKLALSIEQRFNIFENLNGAVFIDAGNIWNVLDDVEDDRATFSSFNSLKDIAIGSGMGLRYDFSFFVFRFDVGFKTYDPFYRDENRWFNDYNFRNAVYNIGINYPF